VQLFNQQNSSCHFQAKLQEKPPLKIVPKNVHSRTYHSLLNKLKKEMRDGASMTDEEARERASAAGWKAVDDARAAGTLVEDVD